MSFKDYKAFANNLEIPILGKTYTVPEISARLGVELHLQLAQVQERQAVMAENEAAVQKAQEAGEEIPELKPLPEVKTDIPNDQILGKELTDQLRQDEVPQRAVDILGETAYYDFVIGREAAEVFWNSGGDPKALQNYIRQQSKLTMSGGEGTTTQKPDSTSGTKSKKTNSQNSTGASKQSTTAKSSKNGGSSKEPSKENSE